MQVKRINYLLILRIEDILDKPTIISNRGLNLKIQIILLMEAQLTEFLLKLTFQGTDKNSDLSTPIVPQQQRPIFTSQQLLVLIHSTLNSQHPRNHKPSLSSDDTTPSSPIKCNCKKSKCLKLYCECFSKGSFCKDCNCQNCNNTQQFSEVRAKAIDGMMVKTSSMNFGQKGHMSGKGCTCKKTGCIKKYCECFNQGIPCNQFCKCNNCQNGKC